MRSTYMSNRELLQNNDKVRCKTAKLINSHKCFFGIIAHAVLDRNPRLGHNTLCVRLIPGNLYRPCPNRHFHTLLGLL